MYFVYMLLCNDGSIYTGITNDLVQRLAKHRSGTGAKYTRSRGAKRILYTERKRTRGSAQKREREIKSWPRAEKLKFVALQTKP